MMGLGLDAASSDTDEASGGGDVQGGGVYRIPNGVTLALLGAAIKPKCTHFYSPLLVGCSKLTIAWLSTFIIKAVSTQWLNKVVALHGYITK